MHEQSLGWRPRPPLVEPARFERRLRGLDVLVRRAGVALLHLAQQARAVRRRRVVGGRGLPANPDQRREGAEDAAANAAALLLDLVGGGGDGAPVVREDHPPPFLLLPRPALGDLLQHRQGIHLLPPLPDPLCPHLHLPANPSLLVSLGRQRDLPARRHSPPLHPRPPEPRALPGHWRVSDSQALHGPLPRLRHPALPPHLEGGDVPGGNLPVGAGEGAPPAPAEARLDTGDAAGGVLFGDREVVAQGDVAVALQQVVEAGRGVRGVQRVFDQADVAVADAGDAHVRDGAGKVAARRVPVREHEGAGGDAVHGAEEVREVGVCGAGAGEAEAHVQVGTEVGDRGGRGRGGGAGEVGLLARGAGEGGDAGEAEDRGRRG
ncbi:hypothetical protein DFJ74DRAFT_289014 [Hyaloraphidium curvatum]|nr:hypothetical protein DFJ74DRAFT_289014 [Hyaloraphidium curvatum]